MSGPKKPADWEAIEREYRAGQISLREIGRRHGCTDTAIRKKAKLQSWQRALADKVREVVREKLVRTDGSQTQRGANDADIVEASAEIGVQIVLSHRNDIARLRRIASTLAERLERHVSGEAVEGKFIGDRESPGDLLEKLSRIDTRVVQLERQAFNLNEPPKLPPGGQTDLSRFSDEALEQLETILGGAADAGGDQG